MSLDGLHTSNSTRQIDHTKCIILGKKTVVFYVIFQNYIQESLFENVICENYSSGSFESIKSKSTVSISFKKTSVFNILFQRGTYNMNTGEAIKNELKVAIPLGFYYIIASSNDKISYTLVSLINHDDESLDCVNYVSDVFDANTGIWWHCDDGNITQISDLPKGVYIR